MYKLLKGLVVLLILLSISGVKSYALDEPSKFQSLAYATSDYLNSLHIAGGNLDLNTLAKKINLTNNVNLSRIVNLFNVKSFATGNISSYFESLVNVTNDYLSSLHITEEGKLDLNRLARDINLTYNVNIKSIMNSINVAITDGLTNLKSPNQNFNLPDVNLNDVLTALNTSVSNGILSLANNIRNKVNLTNDINSLSVDTEDGLLNFTGLAKKYIGSVEEYSVTTEDGYILTLYRIPGNLGKESNIVLLSHGFSSSSDDFIIRGYTSLGYKLAQKDYDVWVLNYRGNRYSRRHVTLNPDTKAKYWNFSMQEYGYFDLAAVIDFILNKTGHQKLSIVGHSEGTAAAFVLLSKRPEYNGKINIFAALSPVCYLSHSGLALTVINYLWPVSQVLFKVFGINEFLGYESLVRKLLIFICSQGSLGYDLCLRVGFGALFGYDPKNLEPEFFKILLGHLPVGTSVKNLLHYNQIGVSGIYGEYDYGSYKNNKIYGSVNPPKYNLQHVTCKVGLFISKNDKILGIQDAEKVRDQLPNVKYYYIVKYAAFTHDAFIYGKNAHKVVYPAVIDLLNQYS